VLSSPLVRAVQTAEIAREVLRVESTVQTTPLLAPEGDPAAVWNELRGLRKLEEVLLAGHEPLMSHLAAWLLGSPVLQIHMTKAALICIEFETFGGNPHGTLNWMLTPKLTDA
jgi:phosphohistidine phosphatase